MQIREVSMQTGLSSDTIRYYERIGLIPPVLRNAAGIREFSEQDVAALEFVHCFRTAGMSIESLLNYLSLCQDGKDQHLEERQAILVAERGRLQKKMDELVTAIQRLDCKIDYYEQEIGKRKG